jgi:uncharacterized RDD family membrane protein YckC
MSAVQPRAVDAEPDVRYLASFASRFGAFAIDGLIAISSTLPGLIVLLASPTRPRACTIGGESTTCSVPSSGWLGLAMTIVVVGFAAQLAWYCVRVSRDRSIGQRAAGLRIVDQRRVEPVGAWRVFARQWARLLSTVPFGLGYLWMLWDDESQTWHDKLTGTIVFW